MNSLNKLDAPIKSNKLCGQHCTTQQILLHCYYIMLDVCFLYVHMYLIFV